MAERKSRIEQILQYALGRESSLPPSISRVEELLIELINKIDSTDGKTILNIGGRVDTVEELPLDADEGTLYFVGYVSSAEKAEYFMTSSGDWEMLGFNTLIVDSDLSENSSNPVMNRIINAALNDKVDKVSGKGLSTEDFTTAEKTKLTELENVEIVTANDIDEIMSR